MVVGVGVGLVSVFVCVRSVGESDIENLGYWGTTESGIESGVANKVDRLKKDGSDVQ